MKSIKAFMKDDKTQITSELSRELSLFHITMMGLGMMIGAGVFLGIGNGHGAQRIAVRDLLDDGPARVRVIRHDPSMGFRAAVVQSRWR